MPCAKIGLSPQKHEGARKEVGSDSMSQLRGDVATNRSQHCAGVNTWAEQAELGKELALRRADRLLAAKCVVCG